MRFIYPLALLIFCISLLLGEEYLLNNFGIATQAFLSLPVMLLSALFFKRPESKVFYTSFLLICVVFAYLLLISAFGGFLSVYRVLGNIVLGILIANPNFRKVNVTYGLRFYYWSSFFLLVITFFTGIFWSEIENGRMTAFDLNSNNCASLLVVSTIIGVLLWLKENRRDLKNLYMITSLLHVFPILSTVSRSGVVSLLFVALFYFVAFHGRKALFTGVMLFAMLIAVLQFISIRYIDEFEIRIGETTDDPRIAIATTAYEIFSDNLVLGVGLPNFLDERWRIRNNLVMWNPSQTSFGVVSIHNSFLDLGLIGGLPLLALYLVIVFYPALFASMHILSQSRVIRIYSAFILSTFALVFIYSFFHQAYVHKHNWFLLGIVYLLIPEIKRAISFRNDSRSRPRTG